MPLATAASIASIVGTGASLFGGSKNKSGGPVDPYKFFPEAKTALKDTYLPDAMKAYKTPYPTLPKQRVGNPATDPFASHALFDLQSYQDRAPKQYAPIQPQQQGIPPEALATLRDELMGRQAAAMPYGMGNNGRGMSISAPGANGTPQQFADFGKRYQQNIYGTR